MDTSCIDEAQGTSEEGGVAIEAIACNAFCFVDDRQSFAAYPVKEGGFADVGSADDGNFWAVQHEFPVVIARGRSIAHLKEKLNCRFCI